MKIFMRIKPGSHSPVMTDTSQGGERWLRSAGFALVLVLVLHCGAARAEADFTSDSTFSGPVASSGNPGITITRPDGDPGLIELRFSGNLESAPALSGPWTPVAGAGNPYRTDLTEPVLFFRSYTPTDAGVFSSRSVVNWVLSGPLQTHFDLAFAGSPDGIFPPKRVKPFFDGSVAMAGVTVPTTMRVRGNSSLQECPFPKLKLKVSRTDREGTPFEDAREIKVGTHCADGGHGNIGRLRDERATYREAMAYESMELMGFLSPRVRRARIEFRDTSPPDAPNPGGWIVTRNALIFDDPDVVAHRLVGHALDDVELEQLRDARFGSQIVTDLRLFHVLIGNWDFGLSEDGSGMWNTDVIRLSDGTYLPMAGDFDLASFVTGQVRLIAPRDFHPDLPGLDRQALYQIGEIRRKVPAAVFESGRGRFTARRAALEQWIRDAEVDGDGKVNALNHLQAFFGALSATD